MATKTLYFSLFLLIFSSLSAQKSYKYIPAYKDSTVNFYFNTAIKDPYQWMEDSNDERLISWIGLQEKFTKKIKRKLLDTYTLYKQTNAMYYGTKEKKLKGYVKNEKIKKSKYQFRYRTQTSSRHPDLLYRLRDEGDFKMLFNVKKVRNDKDDHIQIVNRYVNEKEDLIAIRISHNGSDWHEIHFYDLKDGQKIFNHLKYLRAGSNVIWNGRGVYYDKYDPPKNGREFLDKAVGQKLLYHKIERSQDEDELLYINPDRSGSSHFSYFKKKNILFFKTTIRRSNHKYKILSKGDLSSGFLQLKSFLAYPISNDIQISIEEVFEDNVILKTNWDAPNGRVLVVNLNIPNKPKELVSEYSDAVLMEVNRLGKDKIACVYREDARYLILVHDLEGELLRTIDFPEGKKVNYFYENNEDATHTDFSVSSFFHPDIWCQLSLEDLTYKPIAEIWVPYKAESLETRYVKYKSKDGTDIPMYITCLKETKLDGKNPTLIYGYGGYGITVDPFFDESLTLWLLHGGVLAVPNVRGGGAEGSNWGKEGRRLKKQNAIDDFIGAAEYLINEKYTNKEKLGANGKSHGGLLVAASAIRRPDLFNAVVAEAGPYDMLRFSNFTVGGTNTSLNEFGDVSDKEDFENIYTYSPLQNIKKDVKYPNFLLITGDTDDRVPPLHTYKFLATLQEKGDPQSLFVMYLIPGAGHSGALNYEDWKNKSLYKHSFLNEMLFNK